MGEWLVLSLVQHAGAPPGGAPDDLLEIRPCRDVVELESLLASRDPDAVVIEVDEGCCEASAMLTRRVVRRFPRVAVMLYVRGTALTPALAGCLLRAGRDGVRAVLTTRPPGLWADVRVALRDLRSERTMADTAAIVGQLVPDDVRGIVEQCMREPSRHQTVAALAATLGTASRTLTRRLARAGLPSPHLLVAWARLLAAARLLEDPGRSVHGTARALGFRSTRTFRELLRRHAGVGPSDLRSPGAFEVVLRCCESKLAPDRGARLPATFHYPHAPTESPSVGPARHVTAS
jgi:AraC-like DNA-binding protein